MGASSRTPKKSYRQIQQEKKQMKKSFAVADKLAPKIRAHEAKEEQDADNEIEQTLSTL
ncbi:MAG: hypothetical protein RL023_820 [Candidatus Parcubacteria bacterium]